LFSVPRELLFVAIMCGFLFFYGLGAFGLVGPDEPRYAQVAREMYERNDYVTPTLHGEGWFEKPALYYWRAMFAYETTNRFLPPSRWGVYDWAARVPSATFALGMITIIFFHMRRFRPGAQLDAAIITASCAAVIGFARGASTDMQIAAPFTVAMLGWYAWYETRRKIWLIDLYVFLAIATLAKGPVAVFLAGIIVLVFCYVRKDLRSAFRTLWPPGIVLFLLIALPWYILVQTRNPKFFYVFILQHNLARFSSDVFQHAKPWWFYLPVLMLALAPWTFVAVPAAIDAVRSSMKDWRALRRKAATADTTSIRANVDAFPEFLVIWAILPILFFSISKSKLPGYILPAIAPFTILAADYLQRKGKDAMSPLLMAAHAALSGTIVGLFLVFPYFFVQNQPLNRRAQLITVLVSLTFVLGTYFILRRKGIGYLRAVTLLPVILVMGFILKLAAPTLDNHYSARPVAAELDRLRTTDKPIAVFNVRRDLRYGLAFYRNQKVFNYEPEQDNLEHLGEFTVPTVGHVLVARQGSRPELERVLHGREMSLLGSFPAQKIEYYWVAP
jgi:4-amino-4-deoxy-L-arabinose transferase-like glycosyltransferase